MKKAVIVLLFSISLVYSQQVYQSQLNGFKITYPDDWEIVKDENSGKEISGKSGAADVNVVVKENKSFANKTIEQIADENFKNALVEMYSSIFDNFELLKSEFVSLNGNSAYSFSYKCDLFGEHKLLSIQYFLVNNSRLYGITAACPEEFFKPNEKIMGDIINSFAFTE